MYIEEFKRPFVSKELVEYLQKTAGNLNYLLNNAKDFKTNDEHLGYIKGVNAVITTLDAFSKQDEGEDKD